MNVEANNNNSSNNNTKLARASAAARVSFILRNFFGQKLENLLNFVWFS